MVSAENGIPARAKAASVHVVCPACEAMSFARVGAAGPEIGAVWRCPHCQTSPTAPGPLPRAGQAVDRCWICGTDEFYVQKDFNRELGLAIVLLSAGLIFLVMLLSQNHRLGIALLLGVACLDWIVYRWIASVTVCYLCHSLYRGFPQHAAHSGFYLGNEEKYKHLRRTWLETCVPRENSNV